MCIWNYKAAVVIWAISWGGNLLASIPIWLSSPHVLDIKLYILFVVFPIIG